MLSSGLHPVHDQKRPEAARSQHALPTFEAGYQHKAPQGPPTAQFGEAGYQHKAPQGPPTAQFGETSHQQKAPQGPPTAQFGLGTASSPDLSDIDLLSSVPDSRVELDDLSNLFPGSEASPATIEQCNVEREAEKEFGLDGIRRRTSARIIVE